MTIFNINKNGNIEIVNNTLSYRVPIIEYETEDIDVIEKDMVRKVRELNNSPYFLAPFRVEIINAHVVYYYDVKNLRNYRYLRNMNFKEKLKYYSSLIEIARENKTKTIWDPRNLVLDPYEENIKAIIYETKYIKIHEKSDALKGIKELILISLTDLDSIIGKPRRVNFLDQDDDIIEFAEKVLIKIDNLDDLDDYIKTKQIEYEHLKIKKKNTEEKDVTKKRTFTFNFKKKDKSKRNPNRSRPKAKNNKKISSKDLIMYSGLAILVVLGIYLNVFSNNDKDNSPSNNIPVINQETKENETKNTNPEDIKDNRYDDELLLSYRHFLLNDTQNSIAILETIGYDNLSDLDQQIMLNIYDENDMYEKSIELDPTRAEQIIGKLISEDNIQRIIELGENLKGNNPYVDFEVAYINYDYEKVIDLIDYVELNGRREKQIVESYLNLELYDDAIEFAEKRGNPDLIRMIPSR